MNSPNHQIQYQKIVLRKRMYSEMAPSTNEIQTQQKSTHFKFSSNTANLRIYQQSISNVRLLDSVSDFSLGLRKDTKKIKSTDELILDEFKRHKFKAKAISKSLFSHRPNITYFIKKSVPSKDENKSNSTKFKAKPMPSLSVMEVKKSDRSLTIAHSPFLHTKERFNKRSEKNTHNFTLEN